MSDFDSKTAKYTVEDDERRASHWLIMATGLLLVAVLTWAAFFHLDEIVTGQGRIIPSSREQLIQSLDAGILSEMLVREGEVVEKDQVLLRIDDSRSGPFFQEAREKWLALSALASRLRAEASDSPIEFNSEVLAVPDIAQRERQAYQARKQALDDQLAAMKQSLTTLDREIALISPLVQKRVISEIDLLRLQRQRAEVAGGIAERRNRYLTDANNELVRVESELAQARENARAREDAFKRSAITAPMRGIVKNILVNTVGGVIQVGQNIMEIVPTDEDTLVEAFIRPADVAFLKLGQPATVKLTAYDYNKYGGLDGVLELLSADTMRDETKARRPGSPPIDLEESYYKIQVRITDDNMMRKGKKIVPSPGMTATVDIRTGQKTVLEYILGPLQVVGEALRER
jgi:adhesin transport system membrane fusion protein